MYFVYCSQLLSDQECAASNLLQCRITKKNQLKIIQSTQFEQKFTRKKNKMQKNYLQKLKNHYMFMFTPHTRASEIKINRKISSPF